MINIKSGKGRRQYLREFILSMLSFERTFEKKMRSILDRQYLAVANLVKSGDTDLRNINDVIDNYSGLMTKKLVAHYRRVADFFGRQALDRINKEKGLVSPEEQKLISDFWRNIESWIKVHAAKKVTRMQEVTKKRIASIVQTNMEEGRSNQDLANSLVEKKIANKSRAKLIARTETHGCANNGIFEMMN
ncbi:MAG: hypothetical protein GY757_30845, partial [bacterium]|nr:hypothetical protein [bacterium]